MKTNSFIRDITKIVLLIIFVSIFILPTYLQATEKDLYDFLWLDPDKKVYVLQNKNYQKDNSFYFDIGYSKVINQKFVSGKAFAFRTGYYFHEEWGFEILFNKYFNTNNETFKAVSSVNGSVPFVRKLTMSYGGLAVWSPFYGKINTFNKIYYFDWSFGLGAGQVKNKSNLVSAGDSNAPDAYAEESAFAIFAKTALKFHLTPSFHLNLEYLNTSYSAKSPSSNKDIRKYNSDIMVGIGFSF